MEQKRINLDKVSGPINTHGLDGKRDENVKSVDATETHRYVDKD